MALIFENPDLSRLCRIEAEADALQVQQDFSLAALLAEVHEHKLYRVRGFTSFCGYITAFSSVYRVGRRQAYRLVRGGHILAYLKSHRVPPTSEKQASVRSPLVLRELVVAHTDRCRTGPWQLLTA